MARRSVNRGGLRSSLTRWWGWPALPLLLALAAGFWLGHRQGGGELRSLQTALAEGERQLQRLRLSAEEQAREQARLETNAEVDRASIEALRQSLQRERRGRARLQEQLRFYQGLMAPGESAQGPGIHSWVVRPLPVPRQYHYRLTLHQQAARHSLLSGRVEVEVTGLREGRGHRIELPLLMTTPQSSTLRLGFRYFQHLEGELELPEGFEPLQVHVVARIAKPRSMTVERQFPWQADREADWADELEEEAEES